MAHVTLYGQKGKHFDPAAATDLPHPWNNVFQKTTAPRHQIKFISAQLNAFVTDTNPWQATAKDLIHWTAPDDLPTTVARPIGVFVHAYYITLLPDMLARLAALPVAAHLYISTNSDAKRQGIRRMLRGGPFHRAEVRVFENRGRDIYPKLFGFADVYDRHDLVLHLHTKRSLHSTSLQGWGAICQEQLIGSKSRMADIISSFAKDQALQMVCPLPVAPIQPAMQWLRNHCIAQELARDLHLNLPPPGTAFQFPAGSMFWARTQVLRPLLALDLKPEDFPLEEGQEDDTPAHALERILGLLARRDGGHIAFIGHTQVP